MRRIALLLVPALIVVGAVFWFLSNPEPTSQPSLSAPVLAGQRAPEVTLINLQGEEVSLSQFRGKVVILNFWATWCPPCRAEMPSMESLYRLLGDRDFAMLAVNVEANGRETVPAFLASNPHSFPILLDLEAKAQSLYGVFRFPETFIINQEGVVVDKVIGAIDWTDAKVVSFLQALAKG